VKYQFIGDPDLNADRIVCVLENKMGQRLVYTTHIWTSPEEAYIIVYDEASNAILDTMTIGELLKRYKEHPKIYADMELFLDKLKDIDSKSNITESQLKVARKKGTFFLRDNDIFNESNGKWVMANPFITVK